MKRQSRTDSHMHPLGPPRQASSAARRRQRVHSCAPEGAVRSRRASPPAAGRRRGRGAAGSRRRSGPGSWSNAGGGDRARGTARGEEPKLAVPPEERCPSLAPSEQKRESGAERSRQEDGPDGHSPLCSCGRKRTRGLDERDRCNKKNLTCGSHEKKCVGTVP